jgi:two-component system cell cycle response regulator DivK
MGALILIADDDLDNRAILAATLASAGYRVLQAPDGAAALSEARRLPPDLVLMDLSMPVLDGYAATREFKKDNFLSRIPVLALTAFALAGDEAKALAAGCDGYITKPCLPAEILRRVARELATARSAHGA